MLGELLVGLFLGPTVLDLIHRPPLTDAHLGETVAYLAELGVILLMFIAGLEVHLDQLKRASKVSALAGTLGVIFPVLTGWGVAALFGFGLAAGCFIGLILAATSVSISAQTLMELGLYLALATFVGLRFLPRLVERVAGLPISEGLLATVLLTVLFYARAAEVGGAWLQSPERFWPGCFSGARTSRNA